MYTARGLAAFLGDETVNESQMIRDCMPCLFWNLVVPALAWALVIAGLTWTIRTRMLESNPDQPLDQGSVEHGCVSGDILVVNPLSESGTCCGIFARSQSSMRGEETCMQQR